MTELEYVGHPTRRRRDRASWPTEFAARPERARGRRLAPDRPAGIGDVALACAVSASHRGEAFAACAELVDEVKKRLPIWKRQVFTDGEEEWVACP